MPYPLTDRLKVAFHRHLIEVRKVQPAHKEKGLYPDEIRDRILHVIGEYEHGSSNVEDVGVTLQQYCDVAEDLFLSLINWEM